MMSKVQDVRDVKDETITPFEYHNRDGYHISFTDYGVGGIVIQLHRPNAPHWDKIAGVHLPSDIADSFLHWVSKTAGRAATVLPDETLSVLKGLIADTKGTKVIPRGDRKILKDAIKALENIYSDDVTLEQRALNR